MTAQMLHGSVCGSLKSKVEHELKNSFTFQKQFVAALIFCSIFQFWPVSLDGYQLHGEFCLNKNKRLF